MRKYLPKIVAILLALFGVITLFLSSSVIFDLFGIRAKEGNYVLFIVWTNFISSLIYLISAYGFIVGKRWTLKLLGSATIILIASFIWLNIYINSGGIHETKTIYAMIFRISVTLVFTILAYVLTKPRFLKPEEFK